MEIISFAINLEHIGDIIDKNLSEPRHQEDQAPLPVFAGGRGRIIRRFHKRIMESLRIAFGVFMSGDASEARKLLAEKAVLRNTELAATERHLDRLARGAAPRRWRPPRCISTCCAICGESTRTSARSPIPCLRHPANSPPIANSESIQLALPAAQPR